ncbi:MAG: FHA domain-containing protein [Acidimicrobiales bacterium]
MAAPLLTILKYFLLALLWLFFLRVLRAVWAEVRRPRGTEAAAGPPPPASRGRAPAREREREPAPAGRRAAQPVRLSIVEPPEHRGRSYDLTGEMTVGRAQGCGVALPDDSFTSHLHARVWAEDGRVWVEDLGSTNGTYVNKRKLTEPATLSKGDRLQVGRTVLEVGR